MHAASPTQAMCHRFERHALSVEAFVRAFGCIDGQCGAAFAIAERPFGFDLFDYPDIMRRVLPKLVRSYALDAIECDTQEFDQCVAGAFAEMVGRVAVATCTTQPAVGVGEEIRFRAREIHGGALWAYGQFIHVCGFQDGTQNPGFPTHIRRARERARG